jgi:hypothetical protein
MKAVANITLSSDEGANLNQIAESRLPYVQKAVMDFGPVYPDLVSRRVTTARADNLFGALSFLRQLDSQIDEYKDRIKDNIFNISELLLRYESDMYENAKRYRGDLEGAETVYEFLKAQYENQGPQNPTPPSE